MGCDGDLPSGNQTWQWKIPSQRRFDYQRVYWLVRIGIPQLDDDQNDNPKICLVVLNTAHGNPSKIS